MLISDVRRGWLLFAAGMLSACTGAQTGVIPPGISAPASTADGHRQTGSWMAKGLKQRDLLYVSNANGTVSVYRYWQRTLVGVLTHFTKPLGECADPAGNVYIVDYTKEDVAEYAHGGKKPIKVLDDSPYTPAACGVAPLTGNVAVANAPYGYYSKGNIAVYRYGAGKPAIYYGSSYNDHYTGVAYDNRGDLFTTSMYGYLNFYTEFYYLPKDGKQLILIDLAPPSGSAWSYVQGVAWDGKYWVVASDNQLYRYAINIKAQHIDTIALSGGSSVVGSIAIYRKGLKVEGTQIVGTTSSGNNAAVEYWQYPAGGSPVGSITKYLDAPAGVAISRGSGT